MAKNSIFLLMSLVLFLLTMIECGHGALREEPTAPLATNGEAPRETHNVGEVGADGHLAIWVSKRGTFDVPFLLDDDFGVMLINEGGEKHPRALYVAGSRTKKKVWQTHDLKEFQRLVDSIPKGVRVREYDSCTVNLGYGLPAGVREGFQKSLQRLNLKGDDRNITCICGSLG
ncbi:MAG: hypothetical protein H7Y17_08975 [Chlorobia bacterium]|nr:hypothetical protein [Fimbriimonadaceae bacterium]